MRLSEETILNNIKIVTKNINFKYILYTAPFNIANLNPQHSFNHVENLFYTINQVSRPKNISHRFFIDTAINKQRVQRFKVGLPYGKLKWSDEKVSIYWQQDAVIFYGT